MLFLHFQRLIENKINVYFRFLGARGDEKQVIDLEQPYTYEDVLFESNVCIASFSVLSVVVILAFAVLGQALTPSSYLTAQDQRRLQAVFETAAPYSDGASAHYSILGLKLLGAAIPVV